MPFHEVSMVQLIIKESFIVIESPGAVEI